MAHQYSSSAFLSKHRVLIGNHASNCHITLLDNYATDLTGRVSTRPFTRFFILPCTIYTISNSFLASSGNIMPHAERKRHSWSHHQIIEYYSHTPHSKNALRRVNYLHGTWIQLLIQESSDTYIHAAAHCIIL